MTIWYPDVSNYNKSMPLEAGTVAVCAKASEGTGYTDPYYGHFKAEAARVGAVFFGYHFLHAGYGAAQADHCFAVTGPGINIMIDQEPTGSSNPSVQDAVDFAVRYRQHGGLCTVDYLPKWYWGQIGSPALAPLRSSGLHLVSSSYVTYSDNGSGWQPYGGSTPEIWQYTDRQPYSGLLVDFNAYRGTVDQLKTLLGYTSVVTPPPPPPPPPPPVVPPGEIFMDLISVSPDPTQPGSTGTTGFFGVYEGLGVVHFDQATWKDSGPAYVTRYGPVKPVSLDYYNRVSAMSGKTAISLTDAQVAALGAAIGAAVKLPAFPTTVTGTFK